MDSTKTEQLNVWDLGPTFTFSTAADANRTLLSLVPQSEYYLPGGAGESTYDWNGAQPGDMALLEKDHGSTVGELYSHMLMESPATTGDLIAANFAVYLDSTKTELLYVWDLGAAFAFETEASANRTLLALVPQSLYYTEGAGAGDYSWVGAQADEMALTYFDGSSFHQVLATDGNLMFISLDEWHEMSLEYTVGGTYSIKVDGASSVALAESDSSNTDDIVGLKTYVYGNTATVGYCMDSVASAKLPGDANNDGKVDGSDVTILAGNWQAGVGNPNTTTVTWEMGDFNGDGQVDGSDVTILAGNWQAGVNAAAAAVPEPSSLVMLIALASGFLFRRRR